MGFMIIFRKEGVWGGFWRGFWGGKDSSRVSGGVGRRL